MDLLDLLSHDPIIRELLTRLTKPEPVVEMRRDSWGGLGPLLALLQAKLEKPALYVGSSEEKVRHLFSDCSLFTDKVRYFPGREHELLKDPALEGERTALLHELSGDKNLFIFCSLESLLSPVRSPANLAKNVLRLEGGKTFPFKPFVAALENWNYARAATVHAPNEFAVRGGIIDLYPPSSPYPYRVEWLGEILDTIRIFDPATQRSIQNVEILKLFPPEDTEDSNALLIDYCAQDILLIGESPQLWKEEDSQPFFEWRKKNTFLKLSPTASANALPWPFQPTVNFVHRFRGFLEKAHAQLKENQHIFIYTRQASRLREVLAENHLDSIFIHPQPLHQGFSLPSRRLQVYTDDELFGRVIGLLPHRKSIPSVPVALDELEEGELVVHARHGIASFDGIMPISVEGKVEDYLTLSFAGKDRLYVPFEDMIQVERYVGPPGRVPPLSKLGSREWRNAKKRAKEAAKAIAQDLLKLYASRTQLRGHAYSPDTPWQAELEEAFPFIETPDQKTAIEETKRDMEGEKPMDRLILGDVGYGKTEVALRAAFKAVMDGRQVAVLVPTTILAQQHFETFTERLATFPVRVEVLSRFRGKKEQEQILASLAVGEMDILIGTHRLLQKDVLFKNLGLLIIDEEQRFGVTHKEALKTLRRNIDVLTLSATPIPRTLHFSLMGVRDMSVIETPPNDRLPVKTFVTPKSETLIQQAVQQELKRGGQVYYLYNHVAGIAAKAKELARLVPQSRIAVAHGQMKSAQLEEIMWEFMKGFYDILLCTTIIENGLDIPRVNTLVVEEAEHYGLSNLYQLRGRVGRSDRQGYAYFLTSLRSQVTGPALKRLQVLEEFTSLGSGYQIAMKDLELRGAGNLLGFSQHGHLSHIGFHLYCQLLAEEVKKLKGEKTPALAPNVSLEIPLSAYIPDSYIEARFQKLNIYRRLAASKTMDEVDDIFNEILDRFGPPPEEASNLIEMVKLKILCLERNIHEVKVTNTQIKIRFRDRDEALCLPLQEGLPVKVHLDFLKSELPVIQKRFG